MATYAIGDLQGCLDPLQRLLDHLDYNPQQDKLWFVGDLVNRGPQSLETLRFVRNLDTNAISVLGNHDLHLLAIALTGKKSKGKDTLGEILAAPDRDELIDWLRRRPLAHHDATLASILVHAGIPPAWDIATTLQCTAEVEAILAGDQAAELLSMMYSDQPELWSNQLQGLERQRYIINAVSRMRYLHPDGRMEFKYKCSPSEAPPHLIPWYAATRQALGARIFFGHWSTLGRVRLPDDQVEALALDTGCLWGGTLSAIQINTPDLPLFHEDCVQSAKPAG
jgi:bis(5'-nucleosyl)-tetraphosphatase (symmetrical)